MLKVLLYAFIVFLLNVPFGYWRANTRKFSANWVLAVHTTVPFIFLLRWELGYGLLILPVSILAFFTGQLAGARLRAPIERNIINPSSNLLRDTAIFFFNRPSV